eukprot:Sspe_Gene.91777::Locus_63400_Transcript_1_1_Confidence_1.000_Length_992::g.91777::m.91777
MALTGAASSAARLLLISGRCSHDDPFEGSMPFLLHPTGLKIFGSAPAGAVVGNLALTLGFAGMMAVVMRVVLKLPFVRTRLDVVSYVGIQGPLRFPSSAFIVFALLYQGTAFGSVRTMVYPPVPAMRIVGVLGCVVCMVVPLCTALEVRRSVPGKAKYEMIKPRPHWAIVAIVGPGEWVSTSPENHWVHRYTGVVRTWREKWAWLFIVDFIGMLLFGAATTVRVSTWTGCGHIRVFCAVVNLMQLVVHVNLLPHCRLRDNVHDFVQYLLQLAALVLMAVGYYTHDPSLWASDAAEGMLTGCMVGLVLKFVLDVLSDLYLAFSRRRRTIQE